jgi:4-hydroxybenzoate polyprenyltransferase
MTGNDVTRRTSVLDTGQPDAAAMAPSERTFGLKWLTLLRPSQWLKNGFVLAPLLFSGLATQRAELAAAAITFASFCLLASGGYVINDLRDRVADSQHPSKRFRPLAAGTIEARHALQVGTVLIVGAILLAFAVNPSVGAIALSYLTLALAYSLGLKRLVIIDVFSIAAFYVLRLLAGSAAIGVKPSIWLLICGSLLALYLGFAKRRHELLLMGEKSTDHRSVLQEYSPAFLDQMSVVLLSVTIVSYLMYTISSDTAVRVGADMLAYSSVFVLYGVFRYMYLVHRRQAGGSPTDTLLTDRALLVAVTSWLAYCGWIIYRPL